MFRDGDFPIRPTSMEEIRYMEKLMKFKHDMKNISKAHLKHLEETK
jgi:hypothetical protein